MGETSVPVFKKFKATREEVTFLAVGTDADAAKKLRRYIIKHKPLKACPFCGGDAAVVPVDGIGKIGFIVKCTQCGTRTEASFEGYRAKTKGGYVSFGDALSTVASRWNRRAAENEEKKG